jgi:hypothetical protein
VRTLPSEPTGQSFCEADAEWPEGEDAFERCEVRELAARALDEVARLVVSQADGALQVAAFKRLREYRQRAVDVLGREAVVGLLRERVVAAGGGVEAWEYVEAVVFLPVLAQGTSSVVLARQAKRVLSGG